MSAGLPNTARKDDRTMKAADEDEDDLEEFTTAVQVGDRNVAHVDEEAYAKSQGWKRVYSERSLGCVVIFLYYLIRKKCAT